MSMAGSRKKFWEVARPIGPPIPTDDNDPSYLNALREFEEEEVAKAREAIQARGVNPTNRLTLGFLGAHYTKSS